MLLGSSIVGSLRSTHSRVSRAPKYDHRIEPECIGKQGIDTTIVREGQTEPFGFVSNSRRSFHVHFALILHSMVAAKATM